ncbi:MAG: HAD-IC family P-type ATPase, partial [Anaerolineae bacterium]|nr:HAD-IC family P-type ATPase [Anaerolineae bacterium]
MIDLNQDWHALDAKKSLNILESDGQAGLTAEEAKRRLGAYGANELQEKPPPTFLERLWGQLKDFVVMILLVSAVVSALLGDYIEAIAIMAIVVLNTAIGVIQESRAEEALAALKKMAAPEAHVTRGGHRVLVPSRELVPGDIVTIEAGSIIPADLRLVQSVNLKIEEASLTGESVPVNKYADQVSSVKAGIGDRHNMAFMSTVVTYGRGSGVIVATGMQTEIGHIAEMIQSVEEEDTPLQKKLDQLGKTLGIASLAVCGLVFIIGLLRPLVVGDVVDNWLLHTKELFMVAVSLAIAAVPEGLPAVVTICLALGMQEMVKRHALMRNLPAVETLGSAMIICSDKTGTLTQNQMTVTRVWTDGKVYSVTGRGYNPQGGFEMDGAAIDLAEHPTLRNTLWGSALCNDSELEGEGSGNYRMIGDPTEGAMVVAAAKAGYWRDRLEKPFPRINEIPFDSDRKRMTTIHALDDADVEGLSPIPPQPNGAGYIAIVKGAPDLVLDTCTQIQTASGPVDLTAEQKKVILEANATMASQALRVLAVAYRSLPEVPDEPKPAQVETDLV